MILAVVNDQSLAFVDGKVDSPSGAVPRRLERPVKAFRGAEGVDGDVPVNERVQVIVQPGTGEHFRACIREMGGSIEFDGGDA